MPVRDWPLWERAPWLYRSLWSARAHLRRVGLIGRRIICRAVWPGITYHEDGLATDHTAEMLTERRFVRAYRAGKRTGSWGARDIRWRAYVACWAAQQAAMLDGDFVECGVNRGGLALTVAEYVGLASQDRRFYLLDTFEGIPETSISPQEWALGRRPGGYDPCFEDVQRTFARFPNVILVRGVIPESLLSVNAERVVYLSIDLNCAGPEVAAIAFFWPKLVRGAIVILDDYCQVPFIHQKRAMDAFAERQGIAILALPTGQGLIVKA